MIQISCLALNFLKTDRAEGFQMCDIAFTEIC